MKIAAMLTSCYMLTVGLAWTLMFFLLPKEINHNTKIEVKTNYSDAINATLYHQEYLECLENILLNESLCTKVTNCPAGYPTIGYGHKLWPNDTYTNITSRDAWLLMRSDFDDAVNSAISLGYYYPNNKQLAVAHACYCLGKGAVHKLLHSGRPFNDILSYTKYKKGSEWVTSAGLLKSRNFEVNLYNRR